AAAADDLVQEVLVTVLESLRSGAVREPERLDSFVLGTCRLVARDRGRTESRRRAILETFVGEFETWHEQPPPMDLARLAECLQRLTERDRSVLFLSFYAERTPAQMAD